MSRLGRDGVCFRAIEDGRALVATVIKLSVMFFSSLFGIAREIKISLVKFEY
jgi:hypothetical protein